MNYDIVIAGGGMVGASLALALAPAGSLLLHRRGMVDTSTRILLEQMGRLSYYVGLAADHVEAVNDETGERAVAFAAERPPPVDWAWL